MTCAMTCNIGKTDKVIRVILGLTIIALGIYFKSWWGAVGIVPLITAAMGWCHAYFPFGISTCKSKEKER